MFRDRPDLSRVTRHGGRSIPAAFQHLQQIGPVDERVAAHHGMFQPALFAQAPQLLGRQADTLSLAPLGSFWDGRNLGEFLPVIHGVRPPLLCWRYNFPLRWFEGPSHRSARLLHRRKAQVSPSVLLKGVLAPLGSPLTW